MIPGTEDTRYAYANGIIRALEARFLTRGHFDRLISSPLDNFKTIIADTPYSGDSDIPDILNKETENLKLFFDKYCQTPEVTKLIDLPEQIHNIKIKLKQGPEEMMYPQAGSYVETWPEVIAAVEQYAIDKDPFTLSTSLDIALSKHFNDLTDFAVFFKEYYKLFYDLENIRSFFRTRQFENPRDIFIQVFIPYGSLNRSIFLENFSTGIEHLGKSFFTTPYEAIIDKGGAYLETHHSFLRLERLCDEMRLAFLLQARKMTFGVEPLFGYYQFKQNEIRKIRQVYWAKLNEIDPEELKESIPDVW